MADSEQKPEPEKVAEESAKVVEETKEEAAKPAEESAEKVEEKPDKVEEPAEKVEAVAEPVAEAAEETSPPAEPVAVVAEESKADQPEETVEAAPEPEPETPGVKETHEFSAPECQAESVVVYLDRAEVCRSLKATLLRGEHEIIIKDMSACIDEESIRVEGSGSATISEVSFQKKFFPSHQLEPDQKQEKAEGLRQQMKDAVNDMKVLQTKKVRLMKQRQVLDGFADRLVTPAPESGGKGEAASSLLSTEAIQNMVGFVEMYGAQTAVLDDSLHVLEQDIARLQESMEAIRKNLQQMNVTAVMNETRVLCVLLDVTKDTDIQLKISYVVSKAMWSPKYDLRVFSKDGQLKIFYYGIVQQTTGEDWTDTRLILSTAMPSVGGNIPELDSWKLGFKPRQQKHVSKSNSFLRKAPAQMAKMRQAITKKRAAPQPELLVEDAMFAAQESYEESDEFEALPLISNQAQVKENVTSTMYEIPRTATIPCDNVGHKVSVAIVDLEPTFQHECVPKKSSHAFLRAHVKNTSPYALLAGPSNIFLDNNFIAKADLKAVSPSEEFDCSLGVDPAVKVVYKPVHKFREQSGFMAKHVTFTYKQEIELKNTRQDEITVHVVDQLPQSTEEKIKVKLLEPDVKPADKHSAPKPVRLTAQNNIEWEATIGPGETKELVLKYSVEYPSGEEIL